MERLTKCVFCGEKMFYRFDPQWEEEITIDYFKDNERDAERVYAHLRCCKDIFPIEKEVENRKKRIINFG